MFGRQTFLVIIREDGFSVLNMKNKGRTEIRCTIPAPPHRPFYHMLLAQDERYAIDIVEQMPVIKSIISTLVCILLPDDATAVDMRILHTLFKYRMRANKAVYISPSALLQTGSAPCLTLAQTERCYVLRYIKDKNVLAMKYYSLDSMLPENMENAVRELHEDCAGKNLPLYINGLTGRDCAGAGGIVVGEEEMIRHLEELLRDKSFQRFIKLQNT